MTELNEVTKELLSQGYTRDQTPPGMRPWCDFDGGWTYTWQTGASMVFETPCGLLVKGSHWGSGTMWFGGREWSRENNCPTLCCPHGQKQFCELRHELLQPEHYSSGTLGLIFTCECHRTDKPYNYEQSWDKVINDERAEEDRRWLEFAAAHHGRVCREHSHYNRNTREWTFDYDPYRNCRVNSLGCRYCTVLGKEFSGKKANVYYDLRVTRTVKGCGLIPDEERITITKGIRALDKQIQEEVCEAIAKVSLEEIQWHVNMSHHSEAWFTGAKFEVINLRAERRTVRDLDQDLADIANGIEVLHQSDVEAAAKQAKHKKRAASEEKRRSALKKKIEVSGYVGLSTTDRLRADRRFSRTEIRSIEREADRAPVAEQINLFEEAT